MRDGWRWLAAMAGLLIAAPVQAQPPSPIVPTAERAGINLPVELCALRQERLDTGPASLDATYTFAPDSSLRVSVVRVAQSVDGEFNDVERAIAGYFGDVVMVRDLDVPAGAGEGRARLWRGILDGGRVMTGLWLWHHDGLRIKLRGTVPLGDAGRLWPEIECAVRMLTASG
ncbi:hypothetical protein [Allosphingosinicella sp.]|uniref:hypothetical protein n=1 Tax=Allosphingosinicella sp. TaxID=2823234 RepID=UPI003783824A